jgi:hypothetical protein
MDTPPPHNPYTPEDYWNGVYDDINSTINSVGQTAGEVWSIMGGTIISTGIYIAQNYGYAPPIVGQAWTVIEQLAFPPPLGDAEIHQPDHPPYPTPWSPELPPTVSPSVTEEPDIEEPDWIWTDDGHCNGGQYIPNPNK